MAKCTCKSPQWVLKRQTKRGGKWYRFFVCGNCGGDKMEVDRNPERNGK